MSEEFANSTRNSAPERPIASFRDGVLAFAILVALLYFGRGVLVPVTLAILLSLLIAPVVRGFRKSGLGHAASVAAAVLASLLACTAAAVVLGTQFLHLAASLPKYEQTIEQKLRQLDELSLGRIESLTHEAGRLIDAHRPEAASDATGSTISPVDTAVPVELRAPRAKPFQVLGRVLAKTWPTLEATGIVLVVLVFVLLEYEVLRDRFIRLAGSTNIRLTTLALNDAGERLSRFFLSQFAVNLGVGASIGLGLALLGLPNATLWGALAAVLRFVPYVGIWLGALLATALAMMIVPGWSLAMSVLGVFVLIELIAGQLVEPNLYGHATGLSPLSVVIAAIFWSALWGPIGLILSIPLTLCLLVIGRHLKPLGFLELVLADRQMLSPSQRFYRRVLSGDADGIIAAGRAFLKRASFAAYCDRILLPALHLGSLDFAAGAIGPEQQRKMRDVVVGVVSALAGERVSRARKRDRRSVLDELSPGVLLRQERERMIGKSTGALREFPAAGLLCVGLPFPAHVLAAELLVRSLRNEKLDARHLSFEELQTQAAPAAANPSQIAIAYVVSAFPGAHGEQWAELCKRVRRFVPNAFVVAVLLPGLSGEALQDAELGARADQAVRSFAEAIQIGLERHDGLAQASA